ncbi:hypothetical protein GGR56DRAFT_696296 [Xylariaceae sp. FL0804]|nr:hypothetical protein GGR56DRAFT_696296 [Xylariaceae sp. FL0804]
MGLVDYASSSSSDYLTDEAASEEEEKQDEDQTHNGAAGKKRRKTSSPPRPDDIGRNKNHNKQQNNKKTKKQKKGTTTQPAPPPPLPPAFHDLYASTVRVSVGDDPALHQGRRRVNPHRVGQWPTHVYIEWHPTTAERDVLDALVSDVVRLSRSHSRKSATTAAGRPPPEISGFLTSDLGAPQPLHVSLSRPLSLATADRDGFVDALRAAVAGRGGGGDGNGGEDGVAPFAMRPRALAWHQGPESARSFLVLSVCSSSRGSKLQRSDVNGEQQQEREKVKEEQSRRRTRNGNKGKQNTQSRAAAPPPPPAPPPLLNPELSTLLRRTNAIARAHGQPALYAPSLSSLSSLSTSSTSSSTPSLPPSAAAAAAAAVAAADAAFHISLAWTAAVPPDPDDHGDGDDEDGEGLPLRVRRLERLQAAAEEAFARPGVAAAVQAMRVRVDGVKAKVGNAVTHVPLPSGGGADGGGGGLFGL